MKKIRVKPSQKDERLDAFLAGESFGFSRSYISNLIKEGSVLVNGKATKPSYLLRSEDLILIDKKDDGLVKDNIKPLKKKLDILYEDAQILVINKPANLVVHPAVGHRDDTLINILAALRPELESMEKDRYGIVHRLDKETSGVMIIAKTPQAVKSLTAQIQARKVNKYYKAIIFGKLETPKGKIEAPIRRQIVDRKKMGISVVGKNALTKFEVEDTINGFSLINAYPITGRTHQIRVHFAFIEHPILGDKLYSSRNKQNYSQDMGVKRHMLHAYKLGFTSPMTNQWQEIEAPLPKDFKETLEKIKS